MNDILPSRSATIVTLSFIVFIHCNTALDRLDTVYTDPQYFFRIEIPDMGWSISEATGFPNVLLVIRSDTAVNRFYPNVTVSMENLSTNMTEEEYGKKNQSLLLSQGFSLISTRSIITHHTQFFEIICRRIDVNPILRFNHLCLVRNRIGYTITCIMPDASPNQIQRDLDTIARSFRFI